MFLAVAPPFSGNRPDIFFTRYLFVIRIQRSSFPRRFFVCTPAQRQCEMNLPDDYTTSPYSAVPYEARIEHRPEHRPVTRRSADWESWLSLKLRQRLL